MCFISYNYQEKIMISEDTKIDIKEQINKMVDAVKSNPDIMKQFQEEPVKAIETILGVDLSDAVVEQVVNGVKAKISVDSVSDIAGAIKGIFN